LNMMVRRKFCHGQRANDRRWRFPDECRVDIEPPAMPRWRRVCTAVSPTGGTVSGPRSVVPSPPDYPAAACVVAGLPAARRDHCCRTVRPPSAVNRWACPRHCDTIGRPEKTLGTAALIAVSPREAGSGRENGVAHRQRHFVQNVSYDGTHPDV
jgi:hypothetical protein